jgi:hypothetical protein
MIDLRIKWGLKSMVMAVCQVVSFSAYGQTDETIDARLGPGVNRFQFLLGITKIENKLTGHYWPKQNN